MNATGGLDFTQSLIDIKRENLSRQHSRFLSSVPTGATIISTIL
jgi:hypothetical protein